MKFQSPARNCYKLLVCTLLVALGSNLAKAQQLPLSNFQSLNLYVWNPAYTSDDNFNAHLSHRQQWTGLNGAPVTSFLSANAPLKENMGIGGLLVSDRTGIYQQIYATGSYSYEFKLGEANYLRFGLAVGFHQQSIDLNGMQVDDISDVVLTSGGQPSAASFTSDFGMNYRFRKWNLSLAANQLLRSEPKFAIAGSERRLKPVQHFTGLLSYNIQTYYNSTWNHRPSIMFRTLAGGQFQLDAQFTSSWDKKITLGLGYRYEESMRIISRFQINRYVAVAYTYDFASMGAARMSGGSHEFMISFYHNKPKPEIVPVAKYSAPTVRNRRPEDAKIGKKRDPQKVFAEPGYHIIFGQFDTEEEALARTEWLDRRSIRYELIKSNLGTWYVLSPTVFKTNDERKEYTNKLSDNGVEFSWRFVAGN